MQMLSGTGQKKINTLSTGILSPGAAVLVNNAEDIAHFASCLCDFSLLPLHLDLFHLQVFFSFFPFFFFLVCLCWFGLGWFFCCFLKLFFPFN